MIESYQIAFVVGIIGIIGLFAAIRAKHEIDLERINLKKGSLALRDLPKHNGHEYNYRDWLQSIDSKPSFIDSHFANHLLAAADTTQAKRAISLPELQDVSARREARRFWARVSRGITAMLLVCGIAGTLLSIKPVLGGFVLDDKGTGTTEVTVNINKATDLIQGLSDAFLPSLVALILTLLVAAARGWYTHMRDVLAGELDRLDLEDLLVRFPPPSLSRELDGVRGQLADLTAQMLASQRNLDAFVERLSDAANNFHSDTPYLVQASKHFATGVKALSPSIDRLRDTIDNQLGANSPLVNRFDGLLAVSTQVTEAAAQMHMSTNILKEHLPAAHQLLKETTDALPAQIQMACKSASSIIADTTAKAMTNACTVAVQRLDEAAMPLREAAQSIADENNALKADTSQVIANLTGTLQVLCNSTTETMRNDLNKELDNVVSQVDAHLSNASNQVKIQLDQAKQSFKKSLDTVITKLNKLDASANKAIANIADTVSRMEHIQPQITLALEESIQTRDVVNSSSDKIGASFNMMSKHIDEAMNALVETQQMGDTTQKSLADLISKIGNLTSESSKTLTNLVNIQKSQQDAKTITETLIIRAEQIGNNWQQWLPEATQLQQTGTSLNENLKLLLDQSKEVATQLQIDSMKAAEQQKKLSQEVAIFTDSVLEKIKKIQKHNETPTINLGDG